MLNPDYRDMLFAFADAEVEYMVIGAYAMAAHGHPRATGDLDLWVRPTSANAERVLDALDHFGAPLSDIQLKDFYSPDTVFQIGVSPRRIDILTSIEGVRFDDAWPDRVQVDLNGVSASIIGRTHLIQNKTALDRPQDRADLDRLEGEE
jgi:hypothetical protein